MEIIIRLQADESGIDAQGRAWRHFARTEDVLCSLCGETTKEGWTSAQAAQQSCPRHVVVADRRPSQDVGDRILVVGPGYEAGAVRVAIHQKGPAWLWWRYSEKGREQSWDFCSRRAVLERLNEWLTPFGVAIREIANNDLAVRAIDTSSQ